MAMIETAHKAPFGAITIHRATTALFSTAKTVSNRIAAYVERQRAIAQLNNLSPRLLDDIGLTRADVDELAARL